MLFGRQRMRFSEMCLGEVEDLELYLGIELMIKCICDSPSYRMGNSLLHLGAFDAYC